MLKFLLVQSAWALFYEITWHGPSSRKFGRHGTCSAWCCCFASFFIPFWPLFASTTHTHTHTHTHMHTHTHAHTRTRTHTHPFPFPLFQYKGAYAELQQRRSDAATEIADLKSQVRPHFHVKPQHDQTHRRMTCIGAG